MKKMRHLLLLGVLVLAMFGLTGCGTTKINLNDYVSIKTEGYDTMGTAEIVFDYDKFEDDFDGKIKRDGEEVSTERFLEKCIEGMTLSQTEGLSNGDTVTLEWECDDDRALEKYNCELVYSDIDFEVTGLTEVTVFNPFDYIEVTFTGMEPYGQVEINIEDRDEFDYLYVSADTYYYLSIGDKVTVTVELWYPEDFIEEFGAVLGESTKTFEVTALDKYVATIDEIPEADMETLKEDGKTRFTEHVEDRWDDPTTLQSVEYVGNYFLTRNDGGTGNYLYLIYKVTAAHPEDGQTIVYYYHVAYNSVVIHADGSCGVDSYVSTSGSTFTVDGYYYYGYQDLETFFEYNVESMDYAYSFTTDIAE